MAGNDNKFGHPHLRVLRRLERQGIKILRTDLEGTIRFPHVVIPLYRMVTGESRKNINPIKQFLDPMHQTVHGIPAFAGMTSGE